MKLYIALALLVAAVSASSVPFTWSNCGPSTDPVQLLSASISPGVITFDANLTVAGSIDIGVEIDGAFLAVTIKKEVLGVYVTIPCVDDAGSCTYDLCGILSNNTCPYPFDKYNLPCYCPFDANTYTLPATSVLIPSVPSYLNWLTDGNYQITADLTAYDGTHLGCIYIEASASSSGNVNLIDDGKVWNGLLKEHN